MSSGKKVVEKIYGFVGSCKVIIEHNVRRMDGQWVREKSYEKNVMDLEECKKHHFSHI